MKVNQESTLHWKYHRYEMILKFKRKSAVPSPFSVFVTIVYKIIHALGNVQQEGTYKKFSISNFIDNAKFKL